MRQSSFDPYTQTPARNSIRAIRDIMHAGGSGAWVKAVGERASNDAKERFERRTTEKGNTKRDRRRTANKKSSEATENSRRARGNSLEDAYIDFEVNISFLERENAYLNGQLMRTTSLHHKL